jgi:hypothetical protein
MKKIFTFLFLLFFLSSGKLFSQAPSCRVLGCADNYGTIVTDNTTPDTTFTNGLSFCFLPAIPFKQVYWEYFYTGPVNALFSQSFTPPNSADSVDVDWAIFEIPGLPANLDCPVNTTGWVEQVCFTSFTPGVATGPGIGTDPTFNATANQYYAVAIIVPSGQAHTGVASYTFTIDAPSLNGSPLTALNCAGLVLPVKLSAFNARMNNCGVNLEWTAESETDFKNYEVQYSTDGTSFKTIATLPAAENSGAPQKYSYKDANPAQGTAFYRLKMLDIDGKFSYSKVVTTKLDCVKNPFSVYPNPVTDILTVNNSGPQNENATVKLFDNNGKLIYSHKLLGGTNTVNTHHLPGGIYLLQLNNGIEMQSIKIIK